MRPLAAFVLFAIVVPSAAVADSPAPARSPDEALRALVAGNQAFVAAGATCPRQSPARRGEVAAAQHPIAVVIGCADSRVPPEAIFGQGIGDLFVIRVAGNVIDDAVLGSVEYAVEHVGVPLVVVLGHERCGAVQAALSDEPAHAHIDAIVSRIRAGIEHARKGPGDALDNAVRANVAAAVRDVVSSTPVLAPLVAKGRVKVVGARYDLDSGAVELLPADGAAKPKPKPKTPTPCGLSTSDWCPSPASDPCGKHQDVESCRADKRCKGMRYAGESVIACIDDGSGFSRNCPTVGCISR